MMSSELENCQAPSPECHFTYCLPQNPDLQQGDILSKTPEILKIIGEVHPHYLKDDYINFIVLTQTCDLVRRIPNQCNARYITLAAVRPLNLAIEREINKYQTEFEKLAMVCSNEEKFKVINFIERLLNNNDPEYFYLHEAPQFSLFESSCAFLRLSIAIKSDLHYDACLGSRILSLDEVFQAKLGWLVGNIYSRVGTEDWVPNHLSKTEFIKKAKRLANEVCIWIEEERLKVARQNAGEMLLLNKQKEIRDYIAKIIIKSKREKILDRLSVVLLNIDLVMEDILPERLCKILESDPEFISYTK
jgi:hypothetical protein